jgi:hypothetical protein
MIGLLPFIAIRGQENRTPGRNNQLSCSPTAREQHPFAAGLTTGAANDHRRETANRVPERRPRNRAGFQLPGSGKGSQIPL